MCYFLRKYYVYQNIILWVLIPIHGKVYSIQHYVIKFVSYMWFYPDTPISSKNKIDHHDITKIFVESSVKHHNPNPKILNFLQVMPYFSTQTYSTVVIPTTVLTEDGLLSWHITEQVTTLWKAWQLHFLDTQNLWR